MLTIGIPQLYCGASGKKGAYNRQEIGLARAFAAQGCRAVAFYPAVGAKTVTEEQIAPGVSAVYVPAKALSVNAVYSSWQPLLERGVQAVHVMGDNSLGVPGLYHFCQKHGIFFYSVIGAVYSDASTPARRAVMDFLGRRNLAVYKKNASLRKNTGGGSAACGSGGAVRGCAARGAGYRRHPQDHPEQSGFAAKTGAGSAGAVFRVCGPPGCV
jgi:1,2-diacylglycerol 3-alpha-glucosyltransferase